MGVELLIETALIKKIAKNQATIDADFAKQVVELRMKLLQKKITGEKFWEQYKATLLKSVGKNKDTVQTMLNKIDKEMKDRFKQAEQHEKENKGKPLVDLSLPN